MKPTVTWILVANGTQARVLENTGPGKGLRQVDGLDFGIEALQARELVTDRPGRSFSSVGSGRSAMEPRTDPVEQREAEFAKSVAEMLDEQCGKGAYNRLVIAAAPIALTANMIRIVATGLLHQWVSGDAAQKFSHDISGFVMIPLAALMFWGMLTYLERLFPEVEDVSHLSPLMRVR